MQVQKITEKVKISNMIMHKIRSIAAYWLLEGNIEGHEGRREPVNQVPAHA